MATTITGPKSANFWEEDCVSRNQVVGLAWFDEGTRYENGIVWLALLANPLMNACDPKSVKIEFPPDVPASISKTPF